MNNERPGIKAARECFSKAIGLIDGGKEATPAANSPAASSEVHSVVGFDENVNRNLVVPSPPRAAVVRGAAHALLLVSGGSCSPGPGGLWGYLSAHTQFHALMAYPIT